MEHSRNRPVVDRLVCLVVGQLFGVVLLNQGIDAREGVQAVAQGGLVGGGLSRNSLIYEGASDGAGGEEDGDGEEGAAGAGGHWCWITSKKLSDARTDAGQFIQNRCVLLWTEYSTGG